MDYDIMIFSSPGCNYNELNLRDMKILIKEDSVRITRMENIGSLDLSDLFNAIYNSYDVVFVIIKGNFKDRKFISEYNSFQKVVNEANRILEKRGFTNQRIRILHLIGTDYKKLVDDLKDALLKIIKYGKNPIKDKILETQYFIQEHPYNKFN